MTEKSEKPLLSICIPTYNRADLLEYCLDNVRDFDRYDIPYEIVICDHCSPDNTSQVMEKLKDKYDNIRLYRQERRIFIQQAIYAPMRLGKGKYTVYLADDDKMIISELVEQIKFMEENPSVVVAYSPWSTYDDEQGKEIYKYFEVEKIEIFDKSQALDLLNYVTSKCIYTEMAVYRSDMLHKTLISFENSSLNAFQLSYELLKLGKVAFLPNQFYYEVEVVKKQFSQNLRMNVDNMLKGLDAARAGLEITAHRILSDQGNVMIPDSMRNNMHEIILNYLHNRLMVAYNRFIAGGKYMLASECLQRIKLWRGVYKDDLQKISDETYLLAGLQAIITQYRGMSWLKYFYLVGFKDPETAIKAIKDYDDGVEPQAVDAETIINHAEQDNVMVVVKTDIEKTQFSETEIPPGNVLSLQEWAEYFRIFSGDISLDDV